MEKLRSVQVLRAIAAASVVVFHSYSFAYPLEGSPVRLGAAGVDLFFVISGFIIASIPKSSPQQFLFERAWRVYPIWLLAVVPVLLVTSFSWSQLISSLTLWPIYREFTIPALPVGWTLSFEMLFYLSAALALRYGVRLPLALFALSLVLAIASKNPVLSFVGNPIIFEFLLGVGIARLPREERVACLALGAGIAAFAVSPLSIYKVEVVLDAGESWMRALYWGVPSGLILYAFLSLERFFRRVPTILGDASYSIYLVHIPVIQLAPFHWTIEIVAAVYAGVVVHLLVEKQIQRRRRNVLEASVRFRERIWLMCSTTRSAWR